MDNFILLNGKILTSSYVLDLFNLINKADNDDEVKKVLYDEFSLLVLQGKITFGFVYTDNKENKLRGRIGKFSGFRHGTQYLKLIPANKRPKSISMEPTCLRYYDYGRMSWRSFKKDLFVVATSFYSDKDNKWYDNPIEAGFTTNWNIIKDLNTKFKRIDKPDTSEERKLRAKINAKEAEKRTRQIFDTLKKRFKSK